MPLKSLESLFRSERRSFLHLVNEAWRHNRRFCVRCESSKIYRLADKRYRCARCGYTFHDFTRRWIGELNLTARQWLWVIKLFELEIPPTQLAKEVGISYPTALKAIYLIRRAIAQASGEETPTYRASSEQSVDETVLEPTGRVFGLHEKDGEIRISLVSDLRPEEILGAQSKFAKQGPIIFTGPFSEYDALLLWRFRLSPGLARTLPGGKLTLDGLHGFWGFARTRLSRFHRSSERDFYYFLTELAFRYQHRDEELFDTLVRLVTQLMPKD
jgi:transposase